MSDIEKALTANIDRILNIDSAIYKKPESKKGETISNTSDEDTDDNRLSISEEVEGKSKKSKKKRFEHLRRVMSGIKLNRKNKKNEIVSETLQDLSTREAKVTDEQTKNPEIPRKVNYSSSISRMWISLFPNKESPAAIHVDTDIKSGSTKTLGRLFRRKSKMQVENELIDTPNKASTLSRKLEGLNLNLPGSKNNKIPQTDNINSNNNSPIMSTSSPQNKTAPIPI